MTCTIVYIQVTFVPKDNLYFDVLEVCRLRSDNEAVSMERKHKLQWIAEVLIQSAESIAQARHSILNKQNWTESSEKKHRGRQPEVRFLY